MSEIFFDNFDGETTGQPPSNWDVSGDVTVEDDPSPEYQGDLAMRLLAANGNPATATRSFALASGVVEFNLKIYIDSATTPEFAPEWYPFSLFVEHYNPQNGQGDSALILAFALDSLNNREFVICTSETGRIHLTDWEFDTWHDLKLRFILTEPDVWSFSPLHRVEIELDGEVLSYGYCVNPLISGVNRIRLVAQSFDECPSPDVTRYLDCTTYVDDVSASQEAWEMPPEYRCPAAGFCWLDAAEWVSIEAGKEWMDGFTPPQFYLAMTEGFWPENMAHPHLGKEWHSIDPNPPEGYTWADQYVDIDFGQKTLVEAISILNHNLADMLYLLPGEPWREVVLLAKDDAEGDWEYRLWLLDVLLVGFVLRAMSGGDVRTPLGWTHATVFPNKSYRYWRILIRQYRPTDSDGTALEYFKIGRLLAGTITELVRNFDYEWSLEFEDASASATALTGARWFRELPVRRRITLSFTADDDNYMSLTAQLATLRREPHLYILAPVEDTDELPQLSLYGLIESNPMSLEIRSLSERFCDYEIELTEEVW